MKLIPSIVLIVKIWWCKKMIKLWDKIGNWSERMMKKFEPRGKL